MPDKNFMGSNGFVWFHGVVEDRMDPLMLGRVRVRCYGWHTDDLNLVPKDELPWAHVMQPITSACMNGIGQTPLGPVEGTHVIGFFRDGENAQEPVIIGTTGGIPEDPPDTSVGYNDPNGDYPIEDFLNEPDTNRLARNEKIEDTIVQSKKENRDLGVPIALNDDVNWDEPETLYNAVYPYNHVKESESGHIEEVDDTPMFERLHRFHRSGTFEEIYPDGTRVTKIMHDDYEIVVSDKFVHIAGTCNVTVNGNINVLTGKNLNVQVDANANIRVGGNTTVITEKNANIYTQKDANVTTGGDLTVVTSGYTDISSTGDISIAGASNIDIASEGDLTVSTSGDFSHEVGGSYSVKSHGPMKFKAPRIDLN